MSSIASFMIFEKTSLESYIDAIGTPMPNKSRAALLKHPLYKFRETVATQLTPFHWSGYVFAFELQVYLQNHSIDFTQYSDRKASAKLSDAHGGPVELFTTSGCKKLATELDRVLDNRRIEIDIETFLKKYPKKLTRTDPKLPARAVIDAILVFRYWLSRVPPKYFGELSF